MKKMTGVNLGGWMIPEKWMTPSLFEGLNASDLSDLVASESGRKRLKRHIESWISEEDFRFMANNGVDLVRLPFGFWIFDENPAQFSTTETIDWVMKMAKKYKIKVILDMHAPEFSQNGEQHSGKEGEADWFESAEIREKTAEVIMRIAKKYKNHPALYGIELLNEPKLGLHFFKLVGWYRKVARKLDFILPKSVKIIYHDAFHPVMLAGALRGRRAMMDVHWYIIGPGFFEKFLSRKQYYFLRKTLLSLVIFWFRVFGVRFIVGEWSGVLQQKYFDEFAEEKHLDLVAENVRSQRRIYQKGEAIIYWNYKTEGGGVWNWRSLVENGDIK